MRWIYMGFPYKDLKLKFAGQDILLKTYFNHSAGPAWNNNCINDRGQVNPKMKTYALVG